MIALKKLYGDELLRIALVLSLLRSDPNAYLDRDTLLSAGELHISNGSDWSVEQEARTLIRQRFVHPKSLDNILINYERDLFQELNSLGRYSVRSNNEPMWRLHTYLVNNVATDLVVPSLANRTDDDDQDGVSADDNVAQEVKVEDLDEALQETQESQTFENQDREKSPQHSAAQVKQESEEEQLLEKEGSVSPTNERTPDAVVTLSADFFSNHSESDIFAEIQTRSFDVNEFLVQPNMQIKKEPEDPEIPDVNIKKERENDDLYSDNAMDDFVPYFTSKSEKIEIGENSVFHQNMADLQQYEEMYDGVKDLRNLEYLDVKQQQENLEQYLLENTPLDVEAYELEPIFEEEIVLDVKRERASTSFTSASYSDVFETEIDVKTESDEGHHTGDELTQAVS